MKIDWKQKLSSRKFWAAVVGFVTSILVALNYDELTIEQVSTVITAGGIVVAYIIGESYVDGKRESADVNQEDTVTSREDEE